MWAAVVLVPLTTWLLLSGRRQDLSFNMGPLLLSPLGPLASFLGTSLTLLSNHGPVP